MTKERCGYIQKGMKKMDVDKNLHAKTQKKWVMRFKQHKTTGRLAWYRYRTMGVVLLPIIRKSFHAIKLILVLAMMIGFADCTNVIVSVW